MSNLSYQKIIVAGIAGTIAFTIVLFLGPMMGLPKMDMGEMLGPLNPIMKLPNWSGWILHFIIGVILTGLYAAFFLNILPSKSWKRGAIWALIPFFIAQLIVFPMMGMAVFSGGNVGMIVGSLLTHLAYGSVAGLLHGNG